MAQELKEPGGRRSWRDEARARLVESLGRTGERLGEGLLGESEEDKYLEFLQRTYGSELPRDEEGSIDVPESRPMRESMLDPSDLGMSDKLLMLLSGGGSLMPRAALTAAGTETGMLLGDAKGEYDKGNTTGAGIMTALAGLPPAVAAGLNNKTFMDLGREATSGIGSFMKRNVPSIERSSMVTPEGVDVPLYFSKGSGSMTGGGNKMTTEKLRDLENKLYEKEAVRNKEYGDMSVKNLGKLDIEIGKLKAEIIAGKTMAKVNPTRFLNKLDKIDPRLPKITDNSIPKIGFHQSYETPNTTKVLDDNWNDLATPLRTKHPDYELLEYASKETELLSKFGKKHFSKYGLTPDDINEILPESLDYEEAIKGLYTGDEFIGNDVYELEKIIWDDPKAIRIETSGTSTPQKGVMTTIDGVPVAIARYDYENIVYIPNEQGLAKLAQ